MVARSIVIALTLAGAALAANLEGDLLVDDFSRRDGTTALGTAWRVFSDRVMGGTSEAEVTRETASGRVVMRLRGRVSVEYHGGFVQVVAGLDPEGGTLDAARFEGIRLAVRGNGEPGYYVHLRTADTRLPWQHYRAPLPATEDWSEVLIPFSRFEPRSLDAPLDTRRLVRLGIAAAGRPFDADVTVAYVGFYAP